MRAVIVRDGKLSVEDHADPEPGTGEVLVRVRAAGLNGADMMQRKGHYPAPPDAPQDIPGLELAGEVAAVGPKAHRFREGDRVMGITGGGGQAELAVVHERILMPVPEELSWDEAGGTPEVFTTAHDGVFTQAGLVAGERLLVHGGAGGVGTAAIQLGHAVGARVTATVRNPDLREPVSAMGAIVIGTGAGAKGEINLGVLMMKRVRLLGSTLRARPLELKALTARAVERSVLPALASGAVKVPIAKVYPLEEAQAAYDHFARGGKLGKIVLAMP